MDAKSHWEKIYKTKTADTVSWYLPHLETSLALIARSGTGLSSSIIDVGGSESTLVDDLVKRGYQNVTVLDISETAINVSKQRIGEAANKVHWLVADVLAAELKPSAYDGCLACCSISSKRCTKRASHWSARGWTRESCGFGQ